MKQLSGTLPFLFLLLSANIVVTGNAQTISDNEIKKNIVPINNSLQKITSLEPKIFEYNTNDYNYLKLPGGKQYGFISEEVKPFFPALVINKQHNYMHGKNLFKKATTSTINIDGLVAVLVAAIKEQQMQIDQLRAEIEKLKKR